VTSPHDGVLEEQVHAVLDAEIMKPRISVITLAVDDLERSFEFYREGLGLPTQGSSAANSSTGQLHFSTCAAWIEAGGLGTSRSCP
jgi:catechol-2,3-dioxygenase